MNLETFPKKYIIGGVLGFLALMALLIFNPFEINDSGSRIVVQPVIGKPFVRFEPGLFYAGFQAKTTEWPNQISVLFKSSKPNYELEDNGIEIGFITATFNDKTTAQTAGVVQFILPNDEKSMIELHNNHRTPQSLVTKRLSIFTTSCLQSSSQLMSSDTHSGGGKTQMQQDFLDQLRNGIYLADIKEISTYDSLEKTYKKYLDVKIKRDKDGKPQRITSSIAEYNISVADGSLGNVVYQDIVTKKFEKIIDATTRATIARQNQITAQQEALTAEATGKQKLVQIEYEQKQEQTKLVVAAETEVEVAKQDKLKQQIAYEASILEAKKIKELADAEAYQKTKVMAADGALDKKLAAWIKSEEFKWDAFGKFQGSLVPQFQTGGGTTASGLDYMQIIGAKAAKDLMLDLQPDK